MNVLKVDDIEPQSKDVVQFTVTVHTTDPNSIFDVFEGLANGKHYTMTIKQRRKKRSLSANGYFWLLCQEIAEKLNLTKDEVYRQYIKDVGHFEAVTVRNDALDSFKKVWESNGMGWQCEIAGQTEGNTLLLCFPGSSSYDTKEMSRLIEQVVEDCKMLGIETLTPEELAGLDYSMNEKDREREKDGNITD